MNVSYFLLLLTSPSPTDTNLHYLLSAVRGNDGRSEFRTSTVCVCAVCCVLCVVCCALCVCGGGGPRPVPFRPSVWRMCIMFADAGWPMVSHACLVSMYQTLSVGSACLVSVYRYVTCIVRNPASCKMPRQFAKCLILWQFAKCRIS